jgi:MFS family permease
MDSRSPAGDSLKGNNVKNYKKWRNNMFQQRLWTRDFFFICFATLFLFITFYTLLATLPIYVLDVISGTKQQMGLVMTSFIIAGVIFRPFAGKWLDEYGRKKVLFGSMGLFLLATMAYLFVPNYSFLLVLRVIHGVSFGIVTTATGAIAIDLIPEQRKGEGIGYYAMFMNIAMVIGPFLGLTIINHLNFTVLFVMLSIISLLSFIFGNFIRIPVTSIKNQVKEKQTFQLKNLFALEAIPISVVGMFLSFAYSGILSFIPVYAKELGLTQSASFFFVIYAIMIVLSRPFTGRMFDRLGEHIIIYPSVALYIIGLVSLNYIHTSFGLLSAATIIGLGFGSLFPSFQAIAIKETPVQRRGLATGTYLMFFDMGIGIGSTALSNISAISNYQSMYVFSAVVVFIGGILYYGLHHRKKRAYPASGVTVTKISEEFTEREEYAVKEV